MKKKNALLLFLLSAIILVLAACGTTEDSKGKAEKEKEYKVGILQYVEHPSLNEATKGFKAALDQSGLKIKYDEKNAQGDASNNVTAANNLVGAGNDLIFANATPSAIAAQTATADIPVLFTSVTDAIDAELITSMEKPGGNVTGTIDTHPEAIPKTVKFLAEQLNAKKVGMVFNSGEQNSLVQVKLVKQEAKKYNIEIIEASVATSADVKQATESLIGKVDSYYIITDNTVVSALSAVLDVANDKKIPVMVGELDSVKAGGLGAYGFSYYDIGFEAGEMAIQILKDGKKPADIPAAFPDKLKFEMNEKTAKTIGLTIKEDWKAELVK